VTDVYDRTAVLRALELSVADEPRVPHAGWTHFVDLVQRGELPHLARFEWAVGDATLDALAERAVRSGRSDHMRSVLVQHDDAWVYAQVAYGQLTVWVGSHDDDDLEEIRTWLLELVPEATSEGSTVPVTFWAHGSRYTRALEVPPWAEIKGNYPLVVRDRLEPLLSGAFARDAGQLILWHGAPGAGKTHVVRALAWAWREWCDVHYVTDPEEFFGRASYMLEVLVDEDEDEEQWRLLVLEDTGELLSADAKERTGQGLSRFLNVVDGILGQGLRLLVLVTTNEPLRHLHPAVSRPGRCAAAVEFTAFPPDEAARWLADRGLDPEHRTRTLAELYARAEGREPDPDRPERRVGF
jgi:hypothetical protein